MERCRVKFYLFGFFFVITSKHLKSGRGCKWMLWHAMANIKYQGLSKISYVENRIIKTNLLHRPRRLLKHLVFVFSFEYYSHPVGCKVSL